MGFVEVFTLVMPLFLLMIIVLSVLGIYFLIRVVNTYIKNGKVKEERLNLDKNEIHKMNKRIDQIEKKLNEIK
ncbi:hypothetical protein [Jeotgalibacillus terrae]|uniref:DUF4083 domain-containing protein n=1 Tax=Jeotgalibacillus terrae TaxID=587735 RepID=A0ABW5ZM59_9BACL|nr:hypothetical protein [Jeotgalibacillus terrae]MBM7578122.1 hypothetical protein [Jeotgalibacillus terrae]